jgi:NAD(P)-dependent dehydrogenase (short-subunit alcohol dehydrogenase family)
MLFDKKVAVITGGSSGIGLGIAKDLAKRGARVLITGRNPEKLEQAVAEIGQQASGMVVDIGKVADITALFERVRDQYGRVDVLVANAGGAEPAPLRMITEAHVDDTLNTNLKGVIFTVQGALPLMGNGGSVILIGSTASINPPEGMSVYGAAKAGVRNLVRAWIQELKGSGIRINVVSPGPTRTPGFDAYFPEEQAEGVFALLAEKSTVGRIGAPEDIAQTVSFLASEAAGYINGIELFVDGGASQI